MKSQNIKYFVVWSIVFLITATVIFAGTFSGIKSVPTDMSFKFLMFAFVSSLFYYSIAYIFNGIIEYLLWEGVFKLPEFIRAQGWIKNLIGAVLFTFSSGVIITNVFFEAITPGWLLFYIVILLFAFLLKPNLQQLFSKDLIALGKPFNIGDRISLTSSEGKLLFTGKVLNYSKTMLKLHAPDNTLIMLSNSLLNEMIITKYKTYTEEIRFSVGLTFESNIQSERVLRVLKASLKQAVMDSIILEAPSPGVLFKDITTLGNEFELTYYIKPWVDIDPDICRGRVLDIITKHLIAAGITPAIRNSGVSQTPEHRLGSEISNRIDIISSSDIFKILNPDEIETIARNAANILAPDGAVIMKQGDRGESMFVLVEGILEVFIDKEDGELLKVGRILPGEFLGEMSLFTGESRSATIKAAAECRLLELSKETMLGILSSRKSLIKEFGTIIAERRRINDDSLIEDSLQKDTGSKHFIDKIKAFFNIK